MIPPWLECAVVLATTAYEAAARQRKVAALVEILRKSHVTAENIRDCPNLDWPRVAEAAGVNPPSEQTIAAVIAELERSTK